MIFSELIEQIIKFLVLLLFIIFLTCYIEDREDYIAQKKVKFKIFKTDDGLEKIIELRFMTAHHNDKMIIVPMARIGQLIKNKKGEIDFKIHFADNNLPGHGFSPVLISD